MKKLYVSVAKSAPVRIPSHRSFSPCVMLVTGSNKGDNEIKPKVYVQVSCVYVTTEENPVKPLLGIRRKDVRPIIASNKAPYFQMRPMLSVVVHGATDCGQESF